MIIPSIKKTYNEELVLNTPEIDLSAITSGEDLIITISGENGSGKSTFGKILAGILAADNNTFLLNKNRKVGYMPQLSKAFKMSVMNNLFLNADSSLSKEEKQKKASSLLSKLGLLEFAGKNAQKLSVGQTQKMALARLFMKEYELLILDEPTASMDAQSTLDAEELIKEYAQKTGCLILLITHSKEQAVRLSKTVITFDHGTVI